jgi:peptidyl-prolyl cis-trans isomerase C
MKKSILLLPMVMILALLALLSGCSQKMGDKSILASFDKQVIKASELDKEIAELPEWKQDKYKDQAGREEYLTLMAESRMILDVASKRKLEKNPEVIKQLKEFQDQVMRDELTKQEVDNKVKVSDGDIEKYYAENKVKYVEPDKIVTTDITLKEEAKAKEVMEKLKAGADFTELAKEMDAKKELMGPGSGNGGKTTLTKDSFSSAKNFVDKAFSMNIGEISDIVTQPMGTDTYYMIIRLDEKIPSRQKELAEVKDDIKSTAETEAKDARKVQFYNELRKAMKVETFADRIPPTPEVKEEAKKEEQGETKTEAEVKPEEKKPEEKKADNSKKAEKDVILAKFDKQAITLKEMEKNISEMQEWKQDKYKDQEGKKKYLDELIEEKLLTLEAGNRKINETPEIAKQLKEYRDQLMLKELVKEEIDDKVKVLDADIEKYYNEHKPEYIDPEKVTVTEITLKDEAKAKEVMDKIKAGGDFTAIAKEMSSKGESFGPGQSNGGTTSPFTKDSFSSAKNFVDKAFSLNKGEISDIIIQPIEPDTYYMIIRLDDHTQPRQKELSEVKDDIKWAVEKEKKRERIDQWLAEMKKVSNFQIFTDRIPKPVEKKEEAKPAEGTSTTQEIQKVEGQATQTTEKAVETETKPEEKVETEK